MTTYTLLFDADHLVFTAAAAAEHETRWDADNHVLASNGLEVLEIVNRLIDTKEHFIKDYLGSSATFQHRFAFTGNNLFRHDLFDGYKAGRSRKPLCYWDVVSDILEHRPARRVDDLEADDLMGIWATNGSCQNPIIVSEDKDMLTIPGLLWRQGVMNEISEADADRNWLRQTLSGDSTDGYPGCPGIGPKKAEAYIFGGWKGVVEAFEMVGLSEDDALLQARLARILRATDYEKGKVKLWTPPANIAASTQP